MKRTGNKFWQSARWITRVGFGGFPLGCCLFLLICLVSEPRLLTGLGFFVLMDSIVLVVRTVGMFADASVQQNMRLIHAEIVLLVITSAGMLLELRRRTVLGIPGREFDASVPTSS